MNNEPVAWKVIETDDDGSFTTFTEIEPVWSDRTIPLYTHPVKELPTKEDEYWLMVEMLRAKVKEQQAEINALKKEAALQRLSDFTQEAECTHGVDDGACKECYQEATEPAAWGMTWKDGEIYDVISPAQHAKEEGDYTVPLYLHPAKELDEDFDAICLENKRLQAEIEALKDMLEEEGIGVSQKYLDERIAELGKAQEK